MRLTRWTRAGLALAMAMTTAAALAQALPTITVLPHDHQESRFNQTFSKSIRLDAVNPTTRVRGLFSMNQQRAVEGGAGVATPGPACGPGVDFIEINNQPFEIPAGSLSTTVFITFCGDAVFEGTETLSLTIHPESLVGAQCSANGLTCRAQARIFDSPDANNDIVLRVGFARVEALINAPTTVKVAITMESGNASVVTHRFRTVDGTARSGNAAHFAPGECSGRDPATGNTVTRDFIPRTDFVSIPQGVLFPLPVEIQICPNLAAQPEKSFFLELFDVSANASLGNGRGQIVIHDAPTISVGDTTITEPTSGWRKVHVVASLLAVPLNPVAVSFRTKNDSATAQLGASGICNGIGDYMAITSSSISIQAPNLANNGGFTAVCADPFAESSETFSIIATVDANKVRVAKRTGRVRILDAGPFNRVGGFQFSPDSAQVKVGEITNFSIVWTVPEAQYWRNLNTIDMLVRDDGKDSLWVQWKELDNTFSLCRKSKGQALGRAANHTGNLDSHDEDATRSGIPLNGCSAGFLPGTDHVLETKYASLHLRETTVVDGGSAGKSVTLNLALSFKDTAHGEQSIELAASNDMRQSDKFVEASRVTVVRPR